MAKQLVVAMAALVGLVAFLPLPAISHGVEGSIAPGGWVVTARYDGGEPMSHAKVTITSPTTDQTFQNGRTDRNGRFAFYPDAQGVWQVVVDDEMGHRLRLSVNVEGDTLRAGPPAPPAAAAEPANRLGKALFGVSLILFVGAGLLWQRTRKLATKTHNP